MAKTRYTSGYREYLSEKNGMVCYIPSVTSIISFKPNPYIVKWKKRYSHEQIEAVLKYSSLRGKLIHYNALQQYCNAFITQEPPDLNDIQESLKNNTIGQEIQIAMSLFKEFQSVFTLEPMAVERVVHNVEVGYAGRVDFQGHLITEKQKIPVLVDIKTGQDVYKDDVSLQLTAYNQALDNFAERTYVLLLHPGPTTVEGVLFGGKYAYWSFVRVFPDWKGFIERMEHFQKVKDTKKYQDYIDWDYF